MEQYRRQAILVPALISLIPSPAGAVSALWTDGDGSYGDPTSGIWSAPVVPCNVGAAVFQVTIPDTGAAPNPGDGTPASGHDVTVRTPPATPLNCTVDTLALGANAALIVPSGSSYTVNTQAQISGTIEGSGGGLPRSRPNFQEVSAGSGATLDLSGLTSVTGPQDIDDHLRFRLSGQGSQLRLGSLQTVGSAVAGRTLFETDGAGASPGTVSLTLPSLQSVGSTTFSATGGSSIVADQASFTYSSTGLNRDIPGGGSSTFNLLTATGTDVGTLTVDDLVCTERPSGLSPDPPLQLE